MWELFFLMKAARLIFLLSFFVRPMKVSLCLYSKKKTFLRFSSLFIEFTSLLKRWEKKYAQIPKSKSVVFFMEINIFISCNIEKDSKLVTTSGIQKGEIERVRWRGDREKKRMTDRMRNRKRGDWERKTRVYKERVKEKLDRERKTKKWDGNKKTGIENREGKTRRERGREREIPRGQIERKRERDRKGWIENGKREEI